MSAPGRHPMQDLMGIQPLPVLAALTAALMSTIDTLINGISAIFINDIYKPYIKPNQEDKVYLHAARMTAIGAAIVGIALVPIFASYKSIYLAHGTFIATVTPAMVTVTLLSVFWKRLTAPAAFWTLVLGGISVAVAAFFPQLVSIVDHGASPEGGYKYMRALFGLSVSLILAVVISILTKSKARENEGLVVDSIEAAKIAYKGGEPSDKEYGKKQRVILKTDNSLSDGISISKSDLQALKAEAGDIVYITDARWYLGGMFSSHYKVEKVHDLSGVAYLPEAQAVEKSFSLHREFQIEKII